MSPQALDTRVRQLRLDLTHAPDLRVAGESFGRLMADCAFAERSVPIFDAQARGVIGAVRALAERHGHILSGAVADDGAAVFGYQPAGLIHGALLCLPLIVFCHFERARLGLVVVTGLDHRVDRYRLDVDPLARDANAALRG